jgi:hypothetical protein
MDGVRFDSLVRSFSPSSNRRYALGALLGGALGGLSLSESAAKKKNKKKKKKKCGCRGGRKRLSNQSCAKVCNGESDCAQLCVCGFFSVDGVRYCAPQVNACAEIPDSCSTTAQCPLGQYCADVTAVCGSNRCAPLCG